MDLAAKPYNSVNPPDNGVSGSRWTEDDWVINCFAGLESIMLFL